MNLRERYYALVLLFLFQSGASCEMAQIVRASNLFVLGDVTGSGLKIQGPITAKGNGLLLGANTNSIYMQGNLNLVSTNVLGKIAVGGSFAATASRFGEVSRVLQPLHDFQAIGQDLIADSILLASTNPNGLISRDLNGILTLEGMDPKLNVFLIENPGPYSNLNIMVPAESTAIVNILGKSPYVFQNVFNGSSLDLDGFDPSRVLFNFPNATTLSLVNNRISGTIFAPRATVTMSGTTMSGSLIANKLSIKTSNMYEIGFQGQFTNVPQSIPEPSNLILMSLSSVVMIVYRILKRQNNSVELNHCKLSLQEFRISYLVERIRSRT